MKPILSKHTCLTVLLLLFISLPSMAQINGFVEYHENPSNPLPDVTLELYDSNGDLVNTTVTNNQGQFSFSGLTSGEYTLQANADLTTGTVNLIDASLILQYLLGMYTFTDYEFAAADVNGSGNVTFGDYMLVIISYLMQGNPFPGDDWEFEETNIIVSSSRDSTEDVRMWGTSKGDVEGIWQPGGRDLDYIYADYNEVTTISSDEKEITIGSSFDGNISGYNLNFVYPVSMIEITDVKGLDENFHYDLDPQTGTLKVLWLDESETPGYRFTGEELFTVTARQITDIPNHDVLFNLLDGGMILNSKNDAVEGVSIQIPEIKTVGNHGALKLEVATYPNPVVNSLNIHISSPYNSVATVKVYDIKGALINEMETTVFEGVQVINMETSNYLPGQYAYTISINNENIHGRFMK